MNALERLEKRIIEMVQGEEIHIDFGEKYFWTHYDRVVFYGKDLLGTSIRSANEENIQWFIDNYDEIIRRFSEEGDKIVEKKKEEMKERIERKKRKEELLSKLDKLLDGG